MPRHLFRCPMRWADMDAFGIVNNVMFARYLEEARANLLFSAAAGPGVTQLARGIVVARLEVDYRKPLAWHPEGVAVQVWTEKVGGGSFTLGYDIGDSEQQFAQARTVMVAYDFEAGGPRRLLAEEREFLERYRPES